MYVPLMIDERIKMILIFFKKIIKNQIVTLYI